MPGISVIICTHNPRQDYLAATLKGLREQTLPTSQWELILVDNASEERKKPDSDLNWHPAARTVVEKKLGLTPARLRGIREAVGELLVFVDDDNILDPDFLEQAVGIAREKPFLGAWSGQSRGVFEEPPPEWTRRYWGNLVIREFKDDRWSNLPRLPETMPCGAGMCVRLEVARHYLQLHESGQRSCQLDRAGDSLLSGGDNDLAGCACYLGLGVGIVAGLKLQHLIPPGRLTADYLTRLAEGIHYSSTILDQERGIYTHRRGRSRRLLDRLRLMKLKEPHRSIQAAAMRGHDRAVEFVSKK